MFYFLLSFFLFFLGVLWFLTGFYFLFHDLCVYFDWEIISMNSFLVSMSMIFDYMSLIFTGCVLFISSMVVLYSHVYMCDDINKHRFLILLSLFILSMIFLIISPNMISILLGWDGLGLVSYCLVIYFQNKKSYNAGMLTIITNRIGDVCILVSIAWMMNFGGWNFIFYLNYNDNFMFYVFIFVVLASFTKSAQIPFSSWLPAAMAAPTPVSALVHSSTLVTAGVYLLIRFSKIFLNFDCTFLMIISLMTMFMSGLGANFEYDLKKIIALSTLSQLGLMMSVLFMGFHNLAFFHLLTHAFFKALLFLCAGMIIHSMNDSQDIRDMGFVSKVLPYTSSGFIISSFSLSGMPFLSGFYSKDLILELMFMSNDNIFYYFMFLISVCFTMSYSMRLLNYLMFSGCGVYKFQLYEENNIVMLSMVLLCLLSLFFGVCLNWLMFKIPSIFVSLFLVKIMPFILLFFGGFLTVLVNFYNLNNYNNLLNKYLFFLGSMWFMPNFSTYMIYSNMLLVSKNYCSIVNSGWGEYIFSNSSISFLYFLGKMNYSFEMNNVKLMMISFIFLLLMILI